MNCNWGNNHGVFAVYDIHAWSCSSNQDLLQGLR